MNEACAVIEDMLEANLSPEQWGLALNCSAVGYRIERRNALRKYGPGLLRQRTPGAPRETA